MSPKITLPLPDCVRKLVTQLSDLVPDVTATVELSACQETVNALPEDRKIAYVVLNNQTFSAQKKVLAIRKQFIDSGQIHAVILLPYCLFEGTRISATVIVFSKNNSSVMMVDASKITHANVHHQNILTEENIQSIHDCCKAETEYSTEVSPEEIAENGYELVPSFYVKKAQLAGYPTFHSLLKSYSCSLQFRPDELEEHISKVPTKYQIMQTKNIINGMIDRNLPYLKDFREAYLHHQVKNRNLVISKMGGKVAVADFPDDQIVIAVGRLYVFEIDEEKADPYELLRYLSTEIGQDVLRSCNSSVTIPNLSLEKLLKMPIRFEN